MKTFAELRIQLDEVTYKQDKKNHISSIKIKNTEVAYHTEKKGSKKVSIFDKEREAIEKEIERFKSSKKKELDKYKKTKKDDKAIKGYKDAIKLKDKDKTKLSKLAARFDVDAKEYKAKDLASIIKKLEKRLKKIDKEEEVAASKLREEKKEIAATDLTREEQIRLLNIVKENGISLKEGANSVKMYYEIAKASYLEGLAKGLDI